MPLLYWLLLYAILLSIALWRAGVRARPVAAPPPAAAASPPKRLLIVGATGGTGRQLVTQALERGYEVTAFVRDPTRLPLQHPQLKVFQGNVLDSSSVEAAVRGQDAVLCALGHRSYYSLRRTLSEGTHNLVRAMEAHGVARIICETSLGLGDSAGRLGLIYTCLIIPLVLPVYFWDKTRQERILQASKLSWVVVRPAALTNGPGRGAYRHAPMVGNYLWTPAVSRADVADFMLNQVTSEAYVRQAAGVCG